MFFGFRIQIEQPVDTASFNNVLINNFTDIFGFYLCIKGIIGKYLHNGAFLTKPKTSGFNDLNLIFQPFPVQFILQHFVDQSTL